MKVYWWQGGVHIEPESTKEREALLIIIESLNLIDVHDIEGNPYGIPYEDSVLTPAIRNWKGD